MKKKLHAFTFLFIFCISQGHAQMGWWTWMHGSSSGINPAANGNFGTQGVAAATNDPPRSFNSGDWTDLNGNFWMFAGASPLPDVLWKFDPTTNMWTWVKGPNTANAPGVYGTKGVSSPTNYPGSRIQGMFTWTGTNGDLWLYGGYGNGPTAAQGYLNDLWRYNIASNEWTWMHGDNAATPFPGGSYGTQGVAALTNIPPARREGATAWTDKNGNLWLFGGESALGAPGLSNDLWKYDVTTNMWTWMRGSSATGSLGSYGTQGVASATNDPPARRCYTHWVDNTGNLWFFGGDNYSSIFNDLWKYDVTTNMWTWMRGSNTTNPPPVYGTKCTTVATDDPPARTQNKSCWVDKCGNFWMFGGRNTSNSNFNDMWHYDVAANTWTWVNGGPGAPAPSHGTLNVPAATNMPEPRSDPMTFTQSNGDLWLFGGNYPPVGNNDLWRYSIDSTCVAWCNTPQPPNAGFTATNLSGCAPLTVTFTNTSTNSTSWTWNFGDGGTSSQQNPVHTYTAAGTYTVTLIAHNPPNSDTLAQANYIVVGQPPVLSVASQTSVSCNGGNNGSATVNATGGSTPYTYAWSNGASTSSATGITAGTYTVAVTDSMGCASTQTVSITQPSPLTATTTTTPASCNSSDGTASVSASGGTAPYSYLWSNGSTLSQASNLASQIYSVTITDSNGCTQTSTAAVISSNGPAATATGGGTIQLGSSANLSATGGGTYVWSPAAGLDDSTIANPTATPTATTTYCVFVYDASGCYDSACVTVYVEVPCGEFYLPNAFSPNGDGENDIYHAFINPDCVIEFKLRIYNRWGEKVFETGDVTEGWTGIYRSTMSNTALYTYYCEALFTNGKEILQKGNISLVQ